MQKKIIINQSPALPPNLKALATAPGILKTTVEVLIRFKQETGITVVDFLEIQTASQFIDAISNVVPNSDKEKQLHFYCDVMSDCKNFETWAKHEIIDREGSKIAGIQLTEVAMMEMIQLPFSLILEIIECKRSLDSFKHQLPKEQIFWDYLNIEKGKVTLRESAANEITERLTTYANSSQIKFITEANDLLHRLSELEKSFHVPGIILKGSSLHGNTYQFNESFLNHVQ